MTDQIQPALTPQQWAEERVVFLSCDGLVVHDDGDGLEFVIYPDSAAAIACEGLEDKLKLADWCPNDRHAVAALALLRQPFGFTQEDVEALREVGCCTHHDAKCRSIAARIAALLPPSP